MRSGPLRVVVDARMLLGRFSGVARVVTRLVEALAQKTELRVVALCGDEPYEPWVGRTDLEVVATSFRRAQRTAYRRWRWESSSLPNVLRETNADVFHATWNSGIPFRCPVPALLTIHDLIPWAPRRRGYGAGWQGWWYRHAIRTSARRAARITTVSEFARGDVLDKLGPDPRKVVTVHNGVDAVPAAGEVRSDSPHRFVLYVGGHEPRKNVAGVFAGMRRYWERHGFGLELRLTGRLEALDSSAAMMLNRMPPDAPIYFLGNPGDEELFRQYSSATALLLLSHAEGFGLPALEAMAHGCPVIAAARAALPEVVGDAGILVNPDDAEAVADAVDSVASSSTRRGEFARLGLKRAGEFSWSAAAVRLSDLYQEVAGANRRGAASPREVLDNSALPSIRPLST